MANNTHPPTPPLLSWFAELMQTLIVAATADAQNRLAIIALLKALEPQLSYEVRKAITDHLNASGDSIRDIAVKTQSLIAAYQDDLRKYEAEVRKWAAEVDKDDGGKDGGQSDG